VECTLTTACLCLIRWRVRRRSIASRPAAKRALLTVERGNHNWPADLDRVHRDGWALKATGQNLFDGARLELSDGARLTAFAPAKVPEAEMKLHLAPAVEGLALARPFLAIARDTSGEEWGLIADFAEQAGWVSAGSLRLELGAEPGSAPLELAATRARTRLLACAPAVRTLIAPMPDAVTMPIDLRGRDARLTFDTVPVSQRNAEPAAARPKPPGSTTSKELYIVVTEPAEILRPADLLVLRFRFINFVYRARVGALSEVVLLRADKNADAYLVVYFPPQHVSEKAYYRAGGSADQDPTKVKAPTESGDGRLVAPCLPHSQRH